MSAVARPGALPVAPAGPRGGALLNAVGLAAEAVVIAALVGELGLVLANVVARAYLHHSFLWADEVARLALSILAFLGGAVAYRRRDHAFVRVVLNLLPPAAMRTCLALADLAVLFVACLVAVASLEFLASSWAERTPILQLPATLIAAPLPVAMVLLGLYAVDHLRREHGAAPWVLGIGGAALLALAAA